MLAETLERELKLLAKKNLAWPPDLPAEPLEPRSFDSTYFDTTPRTLARSGMTLRRRVENGSTLWRLKLPAGSARREIEVGGGRTPPRELRALLRAHLACGPLEQLATLRTERSGIRVQTNGRAIADVVLDSVDAVDAAGAASSFREIEIELVDGDQQELLMIRKALIAAGARDACARYAAELALPLAPRPVAKLVDRLEELQDTIGEHQDAVVLEERLRAADRAADSPPVSLAAGRLVERQRRRRRETRAALPDAWRRLKGAGTRAFG